MAQEAIPIANSSHIRGVAFDDESSDLVIIFANGKGYQYQDVEPGVANGFRDAPSPGQYFDQQIKGKYKHTRL